AVSLIPTPTRLADSYMDTRRAILWMIFLLSLLFLWNNWQTHTGQPSLFGGAPTEQVTAPESQGATAVPDAAVPGADDVSVPSAIEAPQTPVPQVATPVAEPAQEPVVVTTDVLRLAFDPLGARVVKAELLN